MAYIANTENDIKEMLEAIGVKTFDELISNIPEDLKFKGELNIPSEISEYEAYSELEKLALQNKSNLAIFAGAGAYDHYVPAAIKQIISRSEFYTAYTPYQAEVSQGTLQAIYEFQSMICDITGMDVANASMYDGATALAEAMLLAVAHTRKNKFVIPANLHPHYRKVLETYAYGKQIELVQIPIEDGSINLIELKNLVDNNVAAVAVQQPNFYGIIEDVYEIEKIAHEKGALFVVSVDILTLGMLEAPGKYGADIVTGDAHYLGSPLNYGGPYLGIFAVKQDLIRKIPGRLAGVTVDVDGNRGFVLTLQTREQQIKREKATSNICSNQGLVMLAATIYLSLIGKEGFKNLANLAYHKAHYLASELTKINGVKLKYQKPFFREFVVDTVKQPKLIINALLDNDILAGVDLARFYEGDSGLLIAVTEKRSKADIDNFVLKLETFLRT
ncbi:MAG TPA: aminomethyl-transferring glycine dehydrogenase subunit GcvPA [Ignavibacteriales bacterium]|nr:aminomethyl-transferring glycine dehydrogenase subunit GcvPA [Ignavibacteriales bacterium]